MLAHVCGKQEPVTLMELVEVTAASRTTALRIASSLTNHRFLDRCEDGRYETGEFLRRLGNRSTEQVDLKERAIPILNKLAISTEETAHFALPLKTQCILEYVAPSPRPIRVASQAGTLVDYHCSSTGKAILAFNSKLTNSLRDKIKLQRRTENTLTKWTQLDDELELVHKRGYAVDEQEYHEGVRCVAVPLIDANKNVVGAIGVTGATSTLTKRRISSLARELNDAAAAILAIE